MYKVHLAETVAHNNTALYEDNTESAGNPAHNDSLEVVWFTEYCSCVEIQQSMVRLVKHKLNENKDTNGRTLMKY